MVRIGETKKKNWVRLIINNLYTGQKVKDNVEGEEHENTRGERRIGTIYTWW